MAQVQNLSLVSKDALSLLTQQPRFLNASICSSQYCISTTQGKGITVFDLESSLALFSLSSPANATFTLPGHFFNNKMLAVLDSNPCQLLMWDDCHSSTTFHQSTRLSFDLHDPILSIKPLNDHAILILTKLGLFILASDFSALLFQFHFTLPLLNPDLVSFECVQMNDASWHCCLFQFDKELSLTTLLLRRSLNEFSLEISAQVKEPLNSLVPKSFAFDGSQACVAFEQTLLLSAWTFSRKSVQKSIIDASSAGFYPDSISIKFMAPKYLALYGCTKESLVLTVWDTRFGTFQHSCVVEDATIASKARYNKTMIDLAQSETLGQVLVLSSTHQSSKKPIEFKTYTFACAYACAPLTLKQAMGKMTMSSNETLVSPEGMDEYDTQLSLKLQNVASGEDIDAIFTEWLAQKSQKYPKTSLMIPQPLLTALTNKCVFEKAKWPRKTLNYLFSNHLMSSSRFKQGIIPLILEKGEFSFIKKALQLHDVSEYEYVALISFLLAKDQESLRSLLGSPAGTLPLDHYMSLVWSQPRNDAFMVQALKALSLEQVEKHLSWIESVILPSDNHEASSSWILSESEPTFSKIEAALNAFSLLMDAHLINLMSSASCAARLQRLQAYVGAETALYSTLSNRVFGLLKPFAQQPLKTTESSGLNKEKFKSERWKRMVKAVQDECGSYCIEVLKI